MANPINIGDFKQRVVFRNYPKTEDDDGGHQEGAANDFLTTWAMVKDGGGSRYFNQGEDQMIDKKDIYVYYRQSLIDNLKVDTFIIYNGKEYSIDKHHMVDEIKRIIKFEVTGASR